MMPLTRDPAFARGRAASAAETKRAVEPISATMQRWEDERHLERTDLVLARLLRAEAISGRRAECNTSDASNMPAINGLLREAIAAHTGKAFRNPLFPE